MKERESQPTCGGKSAQRSEQLLKTFWHYPYASLVLERKPPGWEVTVEKPLSLTPRSVDQLLLHRNNTERRDQEARVMRGLWPHLTDTALLEFKGPTRGLRRRDLPKLLSYGWEYLSQDDCMVDDPCELSLVLAVPTETPTLRREYGRCRVEAQPLGNGYVRLVGSWYTILVVLLDQVANAERDDFLRLFTHDRVKVKDQKALWWMHSWIRRARTMPELKQLEGFDDIVEGLIEALGVEELLRHVQPETLLAGLEPEQRLAGLEPEQVLEHYDAEQRLAGLEPEQVLEHYDAEQRLAGLDAEELKRLQAALDKRLKGP